MATGHDAGSQQPKRCVASADYSGSRLAVTPRGGFTLPLDQEEENDLLRPPLPPFARDTAILKIRAAEDVWNSRDAARVVGAYTADSRWRNRGEFFHGRAEIEQFLIRKWQTELEYRLIKELWSYTDNRIAVRFVYESRDRQGRWWRSHGNENWLFDEYGYMAERHASINDVSIDEADRLFRWPSGPRPDDHPGLSALGL
jgi:nuclear transport factor 2 (NTF2) superfamily protein